jgi:hypothetical protein
MSKTFEHTFEDAGVTVQLRKVNPFMIQEARAALNTTRPKPPVRIVEEEGPLKGTEESMEHDPDYIKQVQEWEAEIDNRVMELQIKRGVVSISAPNWEEEVADLRALFDSLGNSSRLPKDDLVCYISLIASGTPQDLQDFIQVISMRSHPTEEAVQAAKESFRPQPSRQGRVGRQN